MKRDKTLSEISDGVIECKALRRHKLDHYGDILLEGTRARPIVILRRWRCSACPVEAFDTFNIRINQRVRARYYKRPEETKLPMLVSYDDVLREYYARSLKFVTGIGG